MLGSISPYSKVQSINRLKKRPFVYDGISYKNDGRFGFCCNRHKTFIDFPILVYVSEEGVLKPYLGNKIEALGVTLKIQDGDFG